jgi:DnaA family protein
MVESAARKKPDSTRKPIFPMRQLLLDLLPETPPSLANFVADGNAETLAALTAWLAAGDGVFLLCGAASSGKSHLLAASGLAYHDARADADLAGLPDAPPDLAIDHSEALSPAGQQALFNAFNRLRARAGRLLVASRQTPAHLDCREDLRTRLGSGLIYRLTPLSDADKAAALARLAQARGMQMSPEAIAYLLGRAPRDMRILAALLVALDRYSLEHQRPITLPLLRAVLAHPQES